MATAQPLAGLRVIEIGASVAAPYGAWILAELGAEVIKVERPGKGDDARHWGPPFWQDMAAMFLAINRHKKSITVDMRDDAERARLRTLILKTADVVIQNMRPGKVEALGLGAEALRAEKPSLIYCNMGAFGKQGPFKDRPGYDPLMQAFGGLMSVTGEAGQPPVRVGTSIMDMGTGMWAAIGILSALRERDNTGEGMTVDASLYETSVGWMTTHIAKFGIDGVVPGRHGSGVAGIVPYQAYECADGFLVVAAGNDALFKALAGVLNLPHLTEDARFRGNPDRVKNAADLNALIVPVFQTAPRAHWQEKLDAAGIPCGPTQSTAEVLDHPQTRALGIVQDPPNEGPALSGLPLSFGGVRPPLTRGGPAIGEHNEEILGDPRLDD